MGGVGEMPGVGGMVAMEKNIIIVVDGKDGEVEEGMIGVCVWEGKAK